MSDFNPHLTTTAQGLNYNDGAGITGETVGYATTNPYPYVNAPSVLKAYCSRDNHYFECRHETHCHCGKTTRIDVAEGL